MQPQPFCRNLRLLKVLALSETDKIPCDDKNRHFTPSSGVSSLMQNRTELCRAVARASSARAWGGRKKEWLPADVMVPTF